MADAHMTDATVIGAGVMGSAVTRACRAAGLSVTVWNRTPVRVPGGAGIASDLAEALRSSPVLVLCLLNYAVTREVLEPVRPELDGRLVVQTASGVPSQVPTLATWVEAAGGRYLEAAILNYPQAVGTEHCFTVYGGAERDYQEIGPVVAALGGTATYLGADPAYVKAYHTVSAAYYYSIVNGLLECAAIATACGVPLEEFAKSIPMYDPGLRSTIDVGVELMRRGDYGYEQAPLTTHIDILRNLAVLADEARVDHSFFSVLRDRVQRALEKGYRREHVAVVYEQFREPDGHRERAATLPTETPA
ncbi:NAD(P)-binding domain-containing protein [Actinomadura vinacea]|uniref:NAD(P)-binding domain-containing protein n=1 Tax=Actinomadura vinacea TaxID=115336 RepID=A0ABP5VSA3_9ACTN